MKARKTQAGKREAPARRGRFTTAMVGLVAGLALGGCKGRIPDKRPEKVSVNKDPTAPPSRMATRPKKRGPPMTKRRTVRRGDTVFHIENEDGSARPFMRVHKIGSMGLNLQPYNPAYMTPQEYDLFATAEGVRVTYVGGMFPIANITLPFGETRRFEFGDWSLKIRADRGRRNDTATITATVSGVKIR